MLGTQRSKNISKKNKFMNVNYELPLTVVVMVLLMTFSIIPMTNTLIINCIAA